MSYKSIPIFDPFRAFGAFKRQLRFIFIVLLVMLPVPSMTCADNNQGYIPKNESQGSEKTAYKYVNEPFNSDSLLFHNKGVNPKDLLQGIINSNPPEKSEFETTDEYINRCKVWEYTPFLGQISLKSKIAFAFDAEILLSYDADSQTMSSSPFNCVTVQTLLDESAQSNNTSLNYAEVIRVLIDKNDENLPVFSFHMNATNAAKIKHNGKVFLIGFLSFPYITTDILKGPMVTSGSSILYYSKTKAINLLFAINQLLIVSEDGDVVYGTNYDMVPKRAPIFEEMKSNNQNNHDSGGIQQDNNEKNSDKAGSGKDENKVIDIIKAVLFH